MSRIHEALKKAELERAAQQPGDAALPIDLHTGTREEERNAAAATMVDVLPQASVSAVPPTGPLQLADLRAHCAHPKWQPNPDLSVFSDPTLTREAAEKFRILRSQLYQLGGGHSLRTIMVTSAGPGDGKTFVTNNLAQAIVRQPDRRALIIDGDLRASRLHISLDAPKAPGLSEYLRGDADEMSVIQHGQDGGLFLIAGGNAVENPSELLSNGRLKILLDRVGPAFDWIIFDSPPCLPVADATAIATVCDGVLLVVRAGSTPSESAQRASQELRGTNIIGVVLNTVEEDVFSYSSYYGSVFDAREQAKHSRKGSLGLLG